MCLTGGRCSHQWGALWAAGGGPIWISRPRVLPSPGAPQTGLLASLSGSSQCLPAPVCYPIQPGFHFPLWAGGREGLCPGGPTEMFSARDRPPEEGAAAGLRGFAVDKTFLSSLRGILLETELYYRRFDRLNWPCLDFLRCVSAIIIFLVVSFAAVTSRDGAAIAAFVFGIILVSVFAYDAFKIYQTELGPRATQDSLPTASLPRACRHEAWPEKSPGCICGAWCSGTWLPKKLRPGGGVMRVGRRMEGRKLSPYVLPKLKHSYPTGESFSFPGIRPLKECQGVFVELLPPSGHISSPAPGLSNEEVRDRLKRFPKQNFSATNLRVQGHFVACLAAGRLEFCG
ncbi:CKLF-like MARVEL transmembrane domain-containing protein 5 isoform X3 [Choloepus didactylus]|uniref:CKLF-like MARVEL transmembrane domain-containing protein 5 isoform X3 n=1 Tax=Choloepus didactylus TaxID=27675 RepID=UPI00189CBDD6|nr:CKLF-like MARVEL transmembrane domain-containing protein 5 isoform X3 [Choloepus didactylus]